MIQNSHLSFPIRYEGLDGILREAHAWEGARFIKSLPKIISSAQLAKSDKKFLTRHCRQDRAIPFPPFFGKEVTEDLHRTN